MNLTEIRRKFVELSGRNDLVVDVVDYKDNGANFFIQEGSRFLDRKSNEHNREDVALYPVSQGDFVLYMKNIRVIKSVWIYVGDARAELKELPRDGLRKMFPKILSSDTQGVPAYYAPVNARLRTGVPVTPRQFLSSISLNKENINSIIFPPLSQDALIEEEGKFYSDDLMENPENYWTFHHPMLLVWASLYMLEISYRNSEGARDWMSAINDYLRDLELDIIEQDSENLSQLGEYDYVD